MNKKDMIVPSGITFLFTVTPSVSEYHQEGLKYYIKMKSGLNEYYKNIDVEFFNGCYVDSEGLSITDDKLEGKQMLVKVFCPECTVAIDKSNEENFYKQIKQKTSEWIIELIQSNSEMKYSARLEAFYFLKEYSNFTN
jgi:hypothetical protein